MTLNYAFIDATETVNGFKLIFLIFAAISVTYPHEKQTFTCELLHNRPDYVVTRRCEDRNEFYLFNHYSLKPKDQITGSPMTFFQHHTLLISFLVLMAGFELGITIRIKSVNTKLFMRQACGLRQRQEHHAKRFLDLIKEQTSPSDLFLMHLSIIFWSTFMTVFMLILLCNKVAKDDLFWGFKVTSHAFNDLIGFKGSIDFCGFSMALYPLKSLFPTSVVCDFVSYDDHMPSVCHLPGNDKNKKWFLGIFYLLWLNLVLAILNLGDWILQGISEKSRKTFLKNLQYFSDGREVTRDVTLNEYYALKALNSLRNEGFEKMVCRKMFAQRTRNEPSETSL